MTIFMVLQRHMILKPSKLMAKDTFSVSFGLSPTLEKCHQHHRLMKLNNVLAMAMEGNVSSIYKLEYENGIWSKKKFQEIPTKNALKWKFFAIDRNYYLAVANFGNGDREMSRIYKWNWKKRRFTNHQGQD